ncbi:DUF4352 domain-containing protein [Amycolatopsis jejuensis]|uniref:DUF4352 domain-containing protein n=1 Tax=Amycolatopsis jejuensis TaxID=330084 RepID=UPI000527EA5D|nr:DUF4352 domain-containing protein [Amycolatopsis jejuensis]
MAPPRTPKLLLSACLLITVAACGVDGREGSAALGAANAAAKPAAAQASGDLQFGANHRFSSGITVSVSAPQSFQPSAAAYPRSTRAAAFYIEVTNNGTDPYRLSGLSVTATVSGQQAKQVVDATQGLGGITDAGKDLQPGRSTQLTLAFAVPADSTRLALQVRPSAGEPAVATYYGTA